MRKISLNFKFKSLLAGISGVTAQFIPATASAHVKWFAPFDVSQAPAHLIDVLSPTFAEFLVLTLFALWSLCSLERTALGAALLASVDEVFVHVRDHLDTILRAGTAAFFVAVWAHGGIILTPELTTPFVATEWLQLAIAVGLLFRPAMPLSALGIVVLFAQGVWTYGVFHMMDYPIFLGAAAYFAMTGAGLKAILGVRPLDLVRIGASATLLWASVEKWAYPGWSYPVLQSHPHLTLGLEPRTYMVIAGMVEFGLAFALLWTPLVRRMAAVVLLSMFVSAVLEFGKIDAIGHMVIIVVMLAVAADDGVAPSRSPAMAPVWLSVALGLTMLVYYGGHALLFSASAI